MSRRPSAAGGEGDRCPTVPQIRSPADGQFAIEQNRPNVTASEGLSLEEAVLRIPLLLPICGHAQGIAAQRAASPPAVKRSLRPRPYPPAVARTGCCSRLAPDHTGRRLDREQDIALFKGVQNLET